MALKSVKADPVSHLMHLGVRDWDSGKLDAHPVLCIGWFYFKNKVDFQEVKATVTSKCIERITRFRAVPVEKDGWTYWNEMKVEDMDMDYHFTHITEEFKTHEEWQTFLENLFVKGLDLSKPWWKYMIIDKLPCGRSAVLSICDHAMADGASGVTALLKMADSSYHNPVFAKGHSNASARAPTKKIKARQLTAYERLLALWQGVAGPISEQLFNDVPSKLKQPKGVFPKKWKFAFTKDSEKLDVSMFKEIKSRIPGCTVNDVMLAVTALTIKEFYTRIGDNVIKSKQDLTATLAVNARPHGADYLSDEYFGNHIVVGTARYPMHETPVQTLLSFRDSSRMRKNSPDTTMRQYLAKALTYLPRSKVVELAGEASVKFSIMISNVLFALEPIKLFGQEIDGVDFLVSAPLGCYIGVATYKDKVSANVCVTEDVDSDPNEILPIFNEQAKLLHKQVMELDQQYFIDQDKPAQPSIFFWIILVALVAYLVVL